MRHTIVQTKIILPLILLFYSFSFSQGIQKDTIYLNFTYYKDNCIHKDLENNLKLSNKRGIYFNLCGKEILFYNNITKSDTLDLEHLSDFTFTKYENIRELEKSWYYKTKPALIKKYGKIHPNFDKNGKFKTFIIEVINDEQFVIYPVTWRDIMIEY